ncbi:MAG: ABC transporter permease [Devosia sp.]|uniref:ABC transporter permease n=1 Tax=Devosia sp. TaxID=1871048 RepID=UPI001A43EE1A|nr:ABC transporter permease [Devosia sp.]MBL8600044.1 ABC transporter permease [Devosia sp.]
MADDSSIDTSAASAPARSGWLQAIYREWGSELIVLAVIVALGLVVGLGNPVFFSPRNLLNILQAVSVVGIAAIGATLVVISGNLDLSVGATISLGGLMSAIAMTFWGFPFELAIIVGVLTGCAVGLGNGIIITYGRVNSFIVTLGTSSAIAGLALFITNRRPVAMPDSSAWLGQGSIGPVPVSVAVFLVLAVVAQVFLSRSVRGQRITAIGDNQRAAFLSGIPVRATTLLAYVMAGGFAAFAGVLQASSLANAQPAAGGGMVLTIIAGVIIGGTSLLGGRGSIIGTLLGSILLGILSNAFILLRLNPEIQVVSLGLVIVLAALVDQWRMRRTGS